MVFCVFMFLAVVFYVCIGGVLCVFFVFFVFWWGLQFVAVVVVEGVRLVTQFFTVERVVGCGFEAVVFERLETYAAAQLFVSAVHDDFGILFVEPATGQHVVAELEVARVHQYLLVLGFVEELEQFDEGANLMHFADMVVRLFFVEDGKQDSQPLLELGVEYFMGFGVPGISKHLYVL